MTGAALSKSPTGISGFDDVTLGGLPAGRPTLMCGAAGCGKTLFAMTFLVEGVLKYGEPGVLVSFEESAEDLAANVASLGYDVMSLIEQKQLAIDHVKIDPAGIEDTGEYDLEGLFVRLDYAIKSVNAKRVVLDTLEALFASFPDAVLLRAELRRLFDWLKERGVTAIVTAERGTDNPNQLTRHGIEEYVSDCVILLDNRVENQVTTRRLRIVKYRGSAHGTNEYPFLIDTTGISVLPITSAGLAHLTSSEVVSTGITDLDSMLGVGGYFVGSSVLVSGLAGTRKTTFAAEFVEARCKLGERTLWFAFEESPEQIVRNMRSVGLDLAHYLGSALRIESARPSFFGLEMHLARMVRDIDLFKPSAVVIDPISSLRGVESEVHATLLRLVDLLKSRGITAVFTSLSSTDQASSVNDRSISSLMDTWISLSHIETNGERNRLVYVLKSRGMDHSNQVREYQISNGGIAMVPAYVGAGGVLTGSARLAQEAQERDESAARDELVLQKKRELERRRKAVQQQVAELQTELEAEASELDALIEQSDERKRLREADRARMAQLRRSTE
jgi:circadian clock protein KaiC